MDNLSLLMVPGRSSSPPLMLTPIQALTQGFESGEAPRRAMSPASADSHLREGFRIGTLGLMIRYQDGSALTDMPTIYSLPNSPPWFSGMANLHGALIPVCDMAQYLGVERAAQAKPMLLVLGHAADAVGVVIDALPLRLRFTSEDKADGAPIPPALLGCVDATYWGTDQSWMDLDVGSFLQKLADELADLSH